MAATLLGLTQALDLAMDIDATAKLVALIAAVIGLPKIWREIAEFKRSKLKEQLSLSKELLSSLDEASHPLVTECAYHALTGDDSLSAQEIRSLVSLDRPLKALRRYKDSQDFLRHDPSSKSEPFKYKEKYDSESHRNRLEMKYSLTYFFSALAAFIPLIFFTDIFQRSTISLTVAIAAWVLLLMRVGKYNLQRYIGLLAARELLNQQERKV